MAYVCMACKCQECKLNDSACEEVNDICKKCNGNNPPKCKHGKKSKLEELLEGITT